MCKYCEIDIEKYKGKKLFDYEGYESYLSIHRKYDGRFAVQYDEAHAQHGIGIINYCPMCGRKLTNYCLVHRRNLTEASE